MKKPMFPRRNPLGRNQEHGITMVIVATAMVAIIAMAALSIDVITLYLARQEAQRSADAAALAAARVLSVSGMTGTGDTSSWGAVCGGVNSPASLAAAAVGTQNAVGSNVPSTPTVTYAAGGQTGATDCSTLPAAFGVNPMVTVQVRRANLPTFFSRIWGTTSNTVSATATAEAFNPSASDVNGNGPTGTVTPVQPSCVKPWIVPNQNPLQPAITCGAGTCQPFVSTANGAIVSPGVQPNAASGVIGETFTLFADCGPGTPCSMPTLQPQANATGTSFTAGAAPATPNLQYLPAAVTGASVRAVPSCASSGGGGVPEYSPAVAGCDLSTQYRCGAAAVLPQIDLAENPGGPAPAGDSAAAIACLIANDATTNPVSGQDTLDTSSYPYRIRAGAANPTGLSGNVVTSSNSIVSLPIYDTSVPLTFAGGRASVTIVGFLQVFVNQVLADGSINVTVLNVAGCGNATTSNPVTGSSPVPIRLITPP
jgi:hypothetical protein